MENIFDNITLAQVDTKPPPLSLPEKLHKLIRNYNELKARYDKIKEGYEQTMTANIQMEDERNRILNEKSHLEQKVAQLTEELQNKTSELNTLKTKYTEIDFNTKSAVDKIDELLAQCDFDLD
jgi:chromosome segregation ATPase